MKPVVSHNLTAAPRRRRPLWAAGLALAATHAVTLAQDPLADSHHFADVPAGNQIPPVTARLVADHTAIAPGGRFRLGVLLQTAPGWHVYWKNPGDAGLATEVRWTLPEGFAAGPLHWPVPARFDQGGGLAGYGYTRQVLHWAEITAPKDLPLGKSVHLKAEADWLACKGACVPGRAGLDITVAVTDRPRPDNAAMFAAWRRRLPAEPGDGPAAPRVRVAGTPKITPRRSTLTIEIAWPATAPAKLEWFPPASDALEFGRARIAPSAGKTRVRLPVALLDGHQLPAGELEALLAWPDGAARRGLTLRIPLRPASTKPTNRHPLAVRAQPGGE